MTLNFLDSKSVARSGPGKLWGMLAVSLLAANVLTFPARASAEDIQLQSLSPALDTTPPPKKTFLNGQVSHEDSLGESGSANGGESKILLNIKSSDGGPVTLSGGQLRAITDAIRNFLPDSEIRKQGIREQAGRQLQARTAEDVRALQYGVIGMISTKFAAAQPIVDGVFPTCPAALAGILPGDAVVEANGHLFTRGDGPREYWQRIGGKAGTPIDITVLRDGQLLTFRMKRMNIEDISDPAIRSRYERVLGYYGPPRGDSIQISHNANRIDRESLYVDGSDSTASANTASLLRASDDENTIEP